MKRAMKTILFAHGKYYFGELERSGNTRSEFHTVGKHLKVVSVIRRLQLIKLKK